MFAQALPRQWLMITSLVLAAALVIALLLQYLGGHAPCRLCLIQRWPYMGALVIAALAIPSARPRAALPVILVLMVLNAGIAFYHVGIEEGVFALPVACGGLGEFTSVEELRQRLERPPARCDEVSVAFLGFSLSFWNGMLATLTALGTLIVLILSLPRPLFAAGTR